jgi:lipopolysaccharide export system protein LptA
VRRLFLALVLGVLPATLAAQGLGILTHESDEPLEIDADDGIEWNQAKKAYLARGNVRARQGEVTVYADRLTAHYRDAAAGGTEIWRVNADGNVRIASTSETAYGDHGVYDVDQGILVLTGRSLRLDASDASITARDSLEYWEQRQMAVARGTAHAVQAANKLWADILSAYLREDAQGKTAIQRIEAFGQVRIETAQDVVLGDHGLYNLDNRTAILCGGVTIVRGDNRLSGEVAEVNLTTGRARLRPGRCALTVK